MVFCQNCGEPLKDDAIFCSKCGTKVSGSAVGTAVGNVPVGSASIKRPDSLSLIAIVDIVFGAFALLFSILMISSFPGVLSGTPPLSYMYGGYHMAMGPLMLDWMNIMMYIMFFGGFIAGIPMIIGGIGLWNLQNWGRILHVIGWVPVILFFPVGTIIAVLAIWAVYTSEITSTFERASATRT